MRHSPKMIFDTLQWNWGIYYFTAVELMAYSDRILTGQGPGLGLIQCQSVGTGTAEVVVWKLPHNIMQANFVLVPVQVPFKLCLNKPPGLIHTERLRMRKLNFSLKFTISQCECYIGFHKNNLLAMSHSQYPTVSDA